MALFPNEGDSFIDFVFPFFIRLYVVTIFIRAIMQTNSQVSCMACLSNSESIRQVLWVEE
jgi:hypothetical protein